VSFLAKIEQFCAGLIERAFAKTFPSDLEPAQVARKLVSTMEARTYGEDGKLRAPGTYTVYVSPSDFERLAEHHAYLERAWADLLQDLAGKVGVTLDEGEACVAMTPRSGVLPGAIEIAVGLPSHDSAGLRLRTIEGVPPGAVYAIGGAARIGRSEDSEIALVDPSVSRAHAVVEIVEGRAMVRDLGSTNGTYLNGRRVTAQALENGDELRFGNTRMRFESE